LDIIRSEAENQKEYRDEIVGRDHKPALTLHLQQSEHKMNKSRRDEYGEGHGRTNPEQGLPAFNRTHPEKVTQRPETNGGSKPTAAPIQTGSAVLDDYKNREGKTGECVNKACEGNDRGIQAST